MHIPDGFLDPKMSAGLMGAAIASLAYCFSKARQEIMQIVPHRALAFAGDGMLNAKNRTKKILSKAGEKKIVLFLLVISLIFTIQMFDFSIGKGATGHLIGAFFSSFVLGPFLGAIAVSLMLFLQAIFLSDGGIFALGANIVNMAFLGAFVSYYFYVYLKKYMNDTLSIAAVAWFSVVLAALGYAFEMALSGNSNFQEIIFTHFRIGIAEAAATTILIKFFMKSNKNNGEEEL